MMLFSIEQIMYLINFFLYFFIFVFYCKSGLWSQKQFPASETGLTYTIARAGLDSCSRRHHQAQTVTQDQHNHQQLQRQSQRKYAIY